MSLKMSNSVGSVNSSFESLDSLGSHKRSRSGRESLDAEDYIAGAVSAMQEQLPYGVAFSPEEEAALFSTIFELGLKHSSPKVLIPLMPTNAGLNTEHLKSHLQKYRIHHQRSSEEFSSFYEIYIKKQFADWLSSYTDLVMGQNDANGADGANSDLNLSERHSSAIDDLVQAGVLPMKQEKRFKKDASSAQELVRQSEVLLMEFREICDDILQQQSQLESAVRNCSNSIDASKMALER